MKSYIQFKRNSFLSLIVIFFILSNQEVVAQYKYEKLEHAFKIFDGLNLKTGFILNKGFLDPIRLRESKVQNSSDINSDGFVFTSPLKWRTVYESLLYSQIESSNLLNDEILIKRNNDESVVDIGIINIVGNYVNPEVLGQYISLETNLLIQDTPIEEIQIFAISNLKGLVKSKQIKFNLTNDFLFSNVKNQIEGIEIDFDDGNGFKYYNFYEQLINVNYKTKGEKNLRFKLITKSGIYLSYSKLIIKSFDELEAPCDSGQILGGRYEIYCGCDGIFDKPIIVVEGFDPFLNRTPKKIALKYFESAQLQKYNASGYDLVAFTFDNNHDGLQNNAQVLKSLIETVNQLKSGDFENTIIGQSMGGLITRMALAELESDNIDHEVGLYISFDSPHKGANIPLSLQKSVIDLRNSEYLVEFASFLVKLLSYFSALDGEIVDDAISEVDLAIAANQSIAAQQMLRRHIHFPHEINPGFLALNNYLENIGFPSDSRNISLINGSKINRQQWSGNSDDDNGLIDIGEFYYNKKWGCQCCLFKATVEAKVSPVNSLEKVGDFRVKIVSAILPINCITQTIEHEETWGTFFDKPLEIVAGGWNKVPNEIKVNHHRYSFVNTSSSIALTQNLYDSPDGLEYYNENFPHRTKKKLVESGATPFDDIYASFFNSEHTSLGLELHFELDKIITRELMPEELFLQGKEIQSNWDREYEGFNITTGKDVNPWEDKEIDSGEFLIESGADLILTSENNISLKPGTVIKAGSNFTAQIQELDYCEPEPCLLMRAPVVAIDINPNQREVSFDVQSYSDESKEAFYWKLTGPNTDITSTSKRFSTTDLEPGQYSILSSINDGCKAVTKTFIIKGDVENEKQNEKQIDENSSTENVKVYPNPVLDNITIEFAESTKGDFQVSIINSLGATIRNEQIQKGSIVHSLNMAELPKGIYYIELINIEDKTEIFKIVKI